MVDASLVDAAAILAFSGLGLGVCVGLAVLLDALSPPKPTPTMAGKCALCGRRVALEGMRVMAHAAPGQPEGSTCFGSHLSPVPGTVTTQPLPDDGPRLGACGCSFCASLRDDDASDVTP